jgi:hypothetical protein
MAKAKNKPTPEVEEVTPEVGETEENSSDETSEAVELIKDEEVTPEVEEVVDEAVEVNDEEDAKIKKARSAEFTKKLQSFHGITTDELYNDEILTKKYGLKKEEINEIRKYTHAETKDVKVQLNPANMPDYIQLAFEKYGINADILSSQKDIEELVYAGKKTKEGELVVHQLTTYYKKLVAETKNNNINNPVNPALHKSL